MGNLKKINFSLLYFFVLLPFFKTDYITNQLPKIAAILNLLKIISIGFVLFLVIKNRYISKQFQIMLLFSLSVIIPTIIYRGDTVTCLAYYSSMLSIAYLIEHYKTNTKFLGTFLTCYKMLIYANFISMLVFPDGMYTTGTIYAGAATENWLLGFKNVMIVYFLPAYIISSIYKNLTLKRTGHIILTMVILLSTILSKSATSIIGVTVLLIFDYFVEKKKFWKYLNLKTYYLTSIIIFVSILFFKVQNIFQGLFLNIFGKDSTFSNRTNLWDITLKEIARRPIFGNGWQFLEQRHLMYNSKTIITAHNQYLEYLYLGGVVCITLYFLLIIITDKKIKRRYKDKNIQVITLGFFVLQIINMTEVYLNPLAMIPLIMLIYSKNYILGCQNEK